jgi:hypothetical protein
MEQEKEHTQIKKCSNPEIKNRKPKQKTKILSLQKIKRAYLGFISLELTGIVVSWANKNLFE